MNRKYGWIKDKPDDRDFLFVSRLVQILPDVVDLRPTCSSVEDQESLGSCTACALTGNLEFLIRKQNELYWDVSRLFIYYNERRIEGTIREDAGAMLRDGIKSLVRWGYTSETRVPYVIENFTKSPSCFVYWDASKHKISSYYSIRNFNDRLACLADGYPFVFGIDIFESFESLTVKTTGVVPMPQTYESLLGGHAICCVGYNQNDKTFLCRNSWGAKWGIEGYFTLPYEYVEKYGSDFWTIRK